MNLWDVDELTNGDGYLVAPVLDESALDSLRHLVDELAIPDGHGFYSSNVHAEREVAVDVDRRIKAIVGPAVAELLPGFEPFLGAIISKGSLTGDPVEFHQDWTYTDERTHRAVLLWIPLVDTASSNGTLAVVPGSQRWSNGVRPSGDANVAGPHQRRLARLATQVPLTAGSALVYDPAILHGSPPNTGANPRAVAAIAFAPTDAKLVHLHREESGRVSGWAIDADWFCEQEFGAQPRGYATTEVWAAAVSDEDIETGIREAERQVVRPTSSTGPHEARGGTETVNVLGDPELDRLLNRDGFVVFPLISPDEAQQLRDEFLRLHGGSGEGFHSDLTVPDVPYRREVTKVLGEALNGTVRARFPGYEPFLHNFLCKFPGEESELYLHRDWMYVDERKGNHTYVAWIALEDIDGENGQLQVLRSTHRLDGCLRGTDLIPEWLSHQDVIRERLLWIPVKAGDCVVFDNALVHCSAPNTTERPRVVAAVGMKPVGEPLVHFRRLDESTAARYDIDEEFFQTRTPQELLADAPDLPIAETAAFRPRDLDAKALAKELDRNPLAKLDRLQKGLHDVRHAAPRRARNVLTSAVARLPEPKAIRDRGRTAVANAPSKAAIAVLGVNEAVIDRLGPETPAVWEPHQFEWARRVEAAWPKVRAEVESLLRGPTEIPHIEDVTGGIPQGNEGPWRSFILMHQGRWIGWNCERCPDTTALVRTIPGLTMAGFSVLEPGTHITEHRGPNKGALRYQLGVIVPGQEGDCRIRVGDEMLIWRDGEGVMFDFTVPHEAWNDSEGIRVLLMLEVITPLPWYLDRPNRLAQHAMTWFPTTRGVETRLKNLEPTLQRAPL